MKIIRLPGLIDPHVHLRTPGQEYKEDFYTGTCAALAGGFTTIIDMPNNSRAITSLYLLKQKQKLARPRIVTDIGFFFGSTGNNLWEFKKVADKVYGLKLFLNNTTGGYLISLSALERIFMKWPKDKLILVHAEEQMFGAIFEIIKKAPRPIHLCHLSTQFELETIIEAKKQGLPVTCGVTPHHLFLTNRDGIKLGSLGLMKPALKTQKDINFLWQHINHIDLVESDHAPHTILDKMSDPLPFGVPGLETTLPLLLTAVSENRLTIEDVKRLCHDGASKIFNLKKDNLTYIEVDMDQTWTIRNEELLTKCRWSPFDGRKVKGKIKRVYLHGEKVFEDNKLLVQPGFGAILP